MCGIVGYIGTEPVVPILLAGLHRLEYRGYDSAGIVYSENGTLHRHRAKGKLSNLEAEVQEYIGIDSHVGLGHTRWATHGEPNKNNAHPHSDCTGELVVVHNGIIENYSELKKQMARNCALANRKYRIGQFDKSNNLIKVYEVIGDILLEYPNFYLQAIRSCCQGTKASYKGFK